MMINLNVASYDKTKRLAIVEVDGESFDVDILDVFDASSYVYFYLNGSKVDCKKHFNDTVTSIAEQMIDAILVYIATAK